MNGLTPFLIGIIFVVTAAQLAGMNKRNKDKQDKDEQNNVSEDDPH